MPEELVCFIIMPFRPDFPRIHDVIREVVAAAGGIAIRSDDDFRPGNVVDMLKQAIKEADFCVADITGHNPNVLMEVGYARALEKPVIAVRHSSDEIIFDLRTDRILTYDQANLDSARELLARAVAAVIDELAETPQSLAWRYDEPAHLREVLGDHALPRRGADLFQLLRKAATKRNARRWKLGKERELMSSISANRSWGSPIHIL